MTALLNLAKEQPNLVADLARPPSVALATPVIPTFGGDTFTPPPVNATNNSELLLSACHSMFQHNEESLAEFGGGMHANVLRRAKFLEQCAQKQTQMVQAVSGFPSTSVQVLELL